MNIHKIFKLLLMLIINLEKENIFLKELDTKQIYFSKSKKQTIQYQIKFYGPFCVLTTNNRLEIIFRYGKIIQKYLNNRKKI